MVLFSDRNLRSVLLCLNKERLKYVVVISSRYKIAICFFFIFISTTSWAQNLEKIGTKEMLKVSGGLAFNTITYFSSGIDFPSREPFAWYATGNLNISILDMSFPFSYTYSNQGGKFTQPFNRTSVNPSYKWIKSTLGLTSMNFSPYTLTGHLFLGGGVEMTPGKWKISLMAGRLNKAIEYNATDDNLNEIVFGRMGYGIKCGYENKGYGGTLILFKGKDNTTSLPFIPLNSQIKPQDNFVMSLNGKATIFQKFFIEAEYALSALTHNLFDENSSDKASAMSFLNPLVSANSTTDFFQAYKAALKYQAKWMSIGFNFEHIDPGYKTLGGYYFNNDLNNYTLSPSFSLFNKKLNIGANTGFQRNNLSGDKSATTSRWVGSLNVSFAPSAAWMMNATYSNFSTFTKNRPVTDPFYYAPADTMNFYQLTQSASCMTSWNFGKGENKNIIQLMYNFQQSTSLAGSIDEAGAFGTGISGIEPGVPTDIHSANASYSKPVKSIQASFTVACNVNRTYSPSNENTFLGPTLNFQKSLFDKKSSLTFGSTYNRQYSDGVVMSNVFNHRLTFTYAPKISNEKAGKINLSCNANYMQRLAIDPADPTRHEMNIFINLNYSF
ncbi:MAG: hypothetical protein IPM74_19155 [Crocinitomicaceae bacterium]|nr:hypothetical protein [Crocinitomicaceae bacterium]MBK8927961.1 hypothetical protein [Crocinitomicaceae bacterium]